MQVQRIPFLPKNLQSKKQITIVTNNLSVLSILTGSEHIQIVIPGGTVDKQELALCGCNCIEEISSYSFDLSFLAINALHPTEGFSDFRFQEIDIIKTMVKHSRQSIALMDSHKFGKISKKIFLPIDDMDLVITDSNIDGTMLMQPTKVGLRVL